MVSFRKRIKIAPGVNLNLSKGGISTSFGVKGASVSVGKRGVYIMVCRAQGFINAQKYPALQQRKVIHSPLK